MSDEGTPVRPPPTLKELADAVGVSRTTASNAFNRPDQLSPALRDRILSEAHRLGYPGPNPAARMLRTGRAGAIGLVFADPLPYAVGDPTAVAFLQGVARVCERAEAGLLLIPAFNPGAARSTIQAAAVDGFILYCLPFPGATVDEVLERRLPVVAVDLEAPPAVPRVGIDDRAGARMAAAHLLGLGHRRFGVIALDLLPDGHAGPVDEERRAAATYRTTVDRLDGYLEALTAAGIWPESVPVEECPGNSETAACAAASVLLRRSPRPTAILAMSDRLAFGVLRAAADAGLDVPRDLSVIGFDDIPMAAHAAPPLTTIRQPLVDKGAVAAGLLIGEIDRQSPVLLGTELVVRASTGPAPGG